ncbi:hypothetical protein KGM_200193 [Danaus plexippus plexippus]|uniref:Uncharacterized protein n=1 Tax=Danaus plexippus plexippus TaxID=278856 RepID=A0A212F5W8_DANPL|nr:hypothetical protein KGM_200193 [Danaus plexippus plexippus]
MPLYIKKALRQKDRYKVMPQETKRTITNITLSQVFDKIKDITKALNLHAKRNGYFVDYNFRIVREN